MAQRIIELAYNHHEANDFATWLTDHGHEATVGHDTANYIDGVNVDTDGSLSWIMTGWWNAYCKS